MKYRIVDNKVLVGGFGPRFTKKQIELQERRLKRIDERRKKTDEVLMKKCFKN